MTISLEDAASIWVDSLQLMAELRSCANGDFKEIIFSFEYKNLMLSPVTTVPTVEEKLAVDAKILEVLQMKHYHKLLIKLWWRARKKAGAHMCQIGLSPVGNQDHEPYVAFYFRDKNSDYPEKCEKYNPDKGVWCIG